MTPMWTCPNNSLITTSSTPCSKGRVAAECRRIGCGGVWSGGEVPGEGVSLDRGTVGPSEDVAAGGGRGGRRHRRIWWRTSPRRWATVRLVNSGLGPKVVFPVASSCSTQARSRPRPCPTRPSRGLVWRRPSRRERVAPSTRRPHRTPRAPQSCPSPFLKSRTVLRILRMVVSGTSSGTPWAPT